MTRKLRFHSLGNRMHTIKPSTSEQGSFFEGVAIDYLKKQGLEIVEKNVRMKFAEIDIVAKDGNILCFVEVRSRTNTRFGNPEATVDFRKQDKIIKAASMYLQRLYPRIPMCRFDVVAIQGTSVNPIVSYFKNAFGLETKSYGRRRGGPWQVY
jgi:putative endonuclease